jgi:hypothetical protein
VAADHDHLLGEEQALDLLDYLETIERFAEQQVHDHQTEPASSPVAGFGHRPRGRLHRAPGALSTGQPGASETVDDEATVPGCSSLI